MYPCKDNPNACGWGKAVTSLVYDVKLCVYPSCWYGEKIMTNLIEEMGLVKGQTFEATIYKGTELVVAGTIGTWVRSFRKEERIINLSNTDLKIKILKLDTIVQPALFGGSEWTVVMKGKVI